MEDSTHSLLTFKLHLTTIPHAVHKTLVAYTRKLTFRAEGYDYLTGKAFGLVVSKLLTYQCIVYLKIPLAVEAKPVVAHKLRARIFVSRNVVHAIVHPYSYFGSSNADLTPVTAVKSRLL